MTSTSERRRYPRFAAWLPLSVTEVGGKIGPTLSTLLTQNISKAGLCFPAPGRIEPGQFIQVQVTLPGAGPTRCPHIQRRLRRADRTLQETILV